MLIIADPLRDQQRPRPRVAVAGGAFLLPILLAAVACGDGGFSGGDATLSDSATPSDGASQEGGSPPPTCKADGWSTSPAPWELPFDLGGSTSNQSNFSTVAHAIIDLAGDRLLGFIVNRDLERDDPDPLVGKHHWLRFAVVCP
jgi:hypothetical protein